MNKKEIDEFIKSKSVTQDTYVAPTVQRNVSNSIPAMSAVSQKPKTNILKTLVNIPTNMGIGALKTMESVADTISDVVTNPLERKINYAYDYLTKGKKVAQENARDLAQMQQRDIQKDRINNFLNKTGYNDIVDELEKGSLVRRDNLGGQVAQGVGGMVPSLVIGGAYGGTPSLESTKGLTGAAKAKALASNIGRTYMAQAPANAVLGASSYGSGVEEALNNGATMDQARRYGLANAAIEQGTEMITGGVPGLEGKGGLDQFVEPLLDRTKGFVNPMLKAGYRALGEGAEEYAASWLEPLAKKIYSDEKIDWNEVRQNARRAGLVGTATGAVLDAPQFVNELNQTSQKTKKSTNKKVENVKEKSSVEKLQEEITPTEIKEARTEEKPVEKLEEIITPTELSEAKVETEKKKVIDYSKEKYKNFTDSDKETMNRLYEKYKNKETFTKEEQKQIDYLNRKQNGLKNPELKTNNTMEDLKSDYGKYYKNNNLDNFDSTMLDNAKEIVQGNKQGRRTKQEWLDIAQNIGTQAENMGSEALKRYAFESFKAATPNQSANLNRQGKKYVGFGIDEWVNKVYEGAGVGKKVANKVANNQQNDKRLAMENELKRMDVNGKISQNYTQEQQQALIDKVYDKNLSEKELSEKLYDEVVRDQVRKGSDKILNDAAKDTNMTKEEFIKRHYTKDGEKEFGITKEDIGKVYDKYHKSDNVAETKQDNVITVKNNKGQELKLKRDKNNQKVFEKEPPKSYGKSIIPKEVMENQIAKLKDGTKISNFYSNITEKSKFITQENMDKLSQEDLWRYTPIKNKETMENAAKKIGNSEKSLEKAYSDFMSKDFKSAEDVAEGWIFLKRFQDAGNYDAMVQVVKKMKQSGTTGGQIVQAYNIMSRLTPEGMVKYAQSELMDAEKMYNKGNSKKMIDKYAKNFELTGDEVQYIIDQMKTIENMPDGREKNIELAKIQKMLQDKLPPQKGQALKGWMRLSMLFNPKTQIRNVGGNALIVPVNATADVFGSAVDKALSKFTGVRTLGAPSLQSAKDYGRGFVQGGKEAWQDYKMGINTKDVDMNRFEIGQNSKVFNDENTSLKSALNPFAKGLNKMDKILGLAMNGGDRIFYQGAFETSLKNQMRLNNVDTPTQSMIDIATQEALARTWNDSNDYTRFVIDLRNSLNKFSTKVTGTDAYGLGDVLIPFAKTPANLTKAIYDYSPLGFASSIFETKNIKNAVETGQITPQMQHDFAQNVGKGVAGTMLYILGYALAKAKITTGSKDDDKDVANFIQNTMGIQPYSVKIGDHSYTYDWAQPLAAPFAITADAYKNSQNKESDNATKIFDTIMDAANTGFNVLLSQSFFSGIQEVLNNNEGIVNGIQEQILSLPARAVPTFLKQINDMVDRTKRVSYERNQPIKTAKQNAMAKIPKESEKLAANVDTLGNEIQKYGGDKNDVTYFLKVFLSPANSSNAQTSDIASEIYKVYEETGDKNIMPKVAPYYITKTSEGTKDLTSQDREKYQKKSGKLVSEAMVDLLNDNDYKSLSYDEKAEVINGIVNYADAKAKEDITGKISTYYSSADKKITGGMAISDYYLDKVLKKRK